MDRTIHITTMRALADDRCPDRNTCPSINRVADRPGRLYIVTKRVTDPAELAAFAHLVADDEQLGWAPDDLVPEV